MEYATTPVTNSSEAVLGKTVVNKVMNRVETRSIIWHLIKRHKFFLISVWAIFMTIMYLFPPFLDVIKSIF